MPDDLFDINDKCLKTMSLPSCLNLDVIVLISVIKQSTSSTVIADGVLYSPDRVCKLTTERLRE